MNQDAKFSYEISFLSSLKVLADNLNATQFSFVKVENFAGKGENAEAVIFFSPFPPMFSFARMTESVLRAVKVYSSRNAKEIEPRVETL